MVIDFNHYGLNASGLAASQALSQLYSAFVGAMAQSGADVNTREFALAQTHLETSFEFALRAIMLNPINHG